MEKGDIIFVATEAGKLEPAKVIIKDMYEGLVFSEEYQLEYIGLYHLVELYETGKRKVVSAEDVFKAKASEVARWKKFGTTPEIT